METRQSVQNFGQALQQAIALLANAYQQKRMNEEWDTAQGNALSGMRNDWNAQEGARVGAEQNASNLAQIGNAGLGNLAMGMPSAPMAIPSVTPAQAMPTPEPMSLIAAMIAQNMGISRNQNFPREFQVAQAMAPKYDVAPFGTGGLYQTTQFPGAKPRVDVLRSPDAKASTIKPRDVVGPDGRAVTFDDKGLRFKVREMYDVATGQAVPSSQWQEKIDDMSRMAPSDVSVSTQLIDKFNANPTVRKSVEMAETSNTIIGLIDSNNPIADSSIPTFMARASGEVGNLSEADKAPFGGSRSLLEQMKAVVTRADSGELTPENRLFVRRLAETFRKKANENQRDLARRSARQYSQIKGIGMDENSIFNLLVPMELGRGAETEKPATSGGVKFDVNDYNLWLQKRGKK